MSRRNASKRIAAGLIAITMAVGTLVATGTAADARPLRLTVSKLDNAKVPSLCEHPAGRLVNGSLPGISEHDGGVFLNKSQIAFGKLRKGQKRSAAAVLECNRGGVGWPSNVVVYSPKAKVIGVFRLGDITHGMREHVRKVWIKKRIVHVQVANITGPDDAGCCGTWGAKLTMKWSASKQRVVLRSKRVYTERQTAVNLVNAVSSNRRTVALRYGNATVVNELQEWKRSGWNLRVDRCFGPLSEFADAIDGSSEGLEGRGCVISHVKGSLGGIEVMYFDQTGWRTWKAKKLVPVSTH